MFTKQLKMGAVLESFIMPCLFDAQSEEAFNWPKSVTHGEKKQFSPHAVKDDGWIFLFLHVKN